ncbi:MAG TPA: hypothetical protein VFZ65_23655, partial [Planctomycetota bacterium]|nr:hypothetical protein [Planctomycetota bacterium]
MDPEHPPTLRGDASIDSQLDDLRAQLQTLRDRVLNLERATPYQNPADDGAAVESGDAGRSWLSHSAVLRRVATISFVLVIALVLRTLTEGGIVDPVLGVWLGIGYAVLLMAVGWRNLARNRSGQRVFTVCGAVLLCTLVLETHARFDYLGAATARGLLAATLLASVGLGVRYRTPIVVEAGALTAATTALVIGFPLPHFPFAASMLVLATLAGTALIGVRRAAWMHWVALAQLFFFWLLWAIKLQAALDHPEAIAPELML